MIEHGSRRCLCGQGGEVCPIVRELQAAAMADLLTASRDTWRRHVIALYSHLGLPDPEEDEDVPEPVPLHDPTE